MQLVIVRRRYNPFGGAERFIERLIPPLSVHGIQATIIAERWNLNNGDAHKVIQVKSRGLSRIARFKSFSKNVRTVHRCDDGGSNMIRITV